MTRLQNKTKFLDNISIFLDEFTKKEIVLLSLVLIGLYLISFENYLVFHCLVEIFSIVVAFSIFILAWNSRRFFTNDYLLFLGIAYLFIGGVDLVHTLAYTGMGVFPRYDSNLPTQLWIAARYIESISFLIALVFLRRKLRSNYVLFGYSFVVTVLMLSIFYWNNFPDSYIEGTGLTPFKITSEYFISLILLSSLILLYLSRTQFGKDVLYLLMASLIITIFSELAFTFYISLYGFSNLIGHFFKILSFYLIYKAVIVIGLTKPYNLLLRDLKESEELIKKTLSSLDEAVLVIDPGTRRIITCNKAVEYIFGYAMEEMIGKNFEILHLDKNMYESFDKELFPALDKDGVFQTEFQMRRKDGSIFLSEHTITEILDDSGRRTSYVCAIRDINEKKKIEEIRLENERLISINKAKSEFINIMGHELRTPMTSIIGYSSLLKEQKYGELNTKQEFYVDNVLINSQHLIELINDILDLGKIEAGKMELVIEDISLPEIINETVVLLKEKSSRKNITLDKDFDPMLDIITADKQKLKLILFNLFSNAIKFSEDDGGTITISTKKEGDMAKISVSDTGIGIKEEDIDRIFHKFEQLDQGLSRKYEGSGLGLHITKHLVELHGGKIIVESTYGEGSTFTFYLPVINN
jgi:PAS domain S-box-containing protein